MNNDLFSLVGKTALITGGGTGLGKHFAKVLSNYGANVVLCARRTDKLNEVVEEIRATGGEATAFKMDVTDGNNIKSVFSEIERTLGADTSIDVLINNAGLIAEPMLLDLPEDQWDRVLDTNLKGAWLVAKSFAKQLIKHERPGSLINIASILGISSQKGTGPYSVSKAGLIHLTRSMALEWSRYQIRVNAILPGYYATDMADNFLNSDAGKVMMKHIPQRRLGNIEDLSGALLLLASCASGYMTGTTITVDGGHSMRQTI